MTRGRRIVAVAAISAALSGCVATEPIRPSPSGPERSQASAPPSASPSLSAISDDPNEASSPPQPSPTVTAPPIEPQACLLETQPGRADAAPVKGDLTDWSHISGGRARLCLAGPESIELETRTFCTWTDPRDAVREVAALPVRIPGTTVDVDGWVSLERRLVGVGTTTWDGGSGTIDSWQGGPLGQEIRSHDGGRRGIARFDVAPLMDAERPEPTRPTNVVGLLRWSCLEARPA